jgi:dTDP-4-amino-4,6-dideoxygalactose transaminase
MIGGPGLEFFGEEEERNVLDVLRSRQLSRYRFDEVVDKGPSFVRQFEQAMEERLGVEHVLGTNSCTSALLAALIALDIGPGDEVLVPGYTFIASIAAVAYAGAVPVLCEIDDTLTLDVDDLRRRLTPRTKAVLAVHMLGAPCAADGIEDFCQKHGLLLIEDCAQACGASFHGRPLGSIGDAGAFSLNVFKTITAGDGGALSCRSESVFRRAFAFHDHGARPFRLGVAEDAAMLGLNFRMHELTGAVAAAQILKLDVILDACRSRKQSLVDAIGPVAGVHRRSTDPNGECATVLVYLCDTPSVAAKVASNLGIRRLSDSGKHVYNNMEQLLGKKMPIDRGPPFMSSEFPSEISYKKGMLPRTDDLLSRSLAFSIGVSDSYLGTGYGIGPRSGVGEIERAGQRIQQAFIAAVR